MKDLNVLSYQEENGVATVTLGPQVNVSLIRDLQTICEHLEDESSCDVVIFRGSPARFCGEIDLREFDLGKPLDIHGFHRWEKVLTWIERLNRFTIAAIEGRCVGAGFHLALVCDQRLATHQATIGANEVSLGFLPGMATFRLAKYVGLGRAKAMTLTSKILDANQAESWGLIDQVVDSDAFESELHDLALACRPRSTVALELGRRLLNESYAIQYEEFIGNFLAAQHRAITSEAFARLLNKMKKE